jgi:teichuronic acid biosynthesis glycosyltransferase TuaC
MNILVISHLFPSPINETYGTFVYEQVEQLQKIGCDVTVIAPIRHAPFPLNLLKKKWADYASCPLSRKVNGIEVYYPRYISLPKGILFSYTGETMFKEVYPLVKKLHSTKKFDIIHAHVALPNGYAAMKIAKRLNIPYVVQVHGQDLQKTIHKNSRCKNAVEKTLNNANEVILVSNKLKRLQDENLDVTTPTTVLFNGVSSLFLESSSTKPAGTPFTILSASNIVPEKGLVYNIEAVRELISKGYNVQYKIVGSGYEENKLKALVEKYKLNDVIHFCGRYNRQKTKIAMDECDVYSMPSWNEAFGVVYLEAMASGKPVIGCIGQGIEDIVEDKINGFLVPPHSSTDIAKIIEQLINDQHLSMQVGKNAKLHIKENFSWAKNAISTKEIYETSIERNGG